MYEPIQHNFRTEERTQSVSPAPNAFPSLFWSSANVGTRSFFFCKRKNNGTADIVGRGLPQSLFCLQKWRALSWMAFYIFSRKTPHAHEQLLFFSRKGHRKRKRNSFVVVSLYAPFSLEWPCRHDSSIEESQSTVQPIRDHWI